jgi:lysophospholipase L1-like esterase
MNKLRIFIYANLAAALALLAALLVWKLVLAGEKPGTLVLGISSFLILYSIFCAASLAAIKTGRGGTVLKLWLFLVMMAVFYVIVDFAGGYFIFERGDMGSKNVGDEYVHHKYAPFSEIRKYNPYDFDVRSTVNNLGWRGKDVSADKAASEFRIVLLGDSFTMGYGVKDEEMFSQVLESCLGGSADKRIRVISAAVSSYSPILEYMTLKRNIDALKPDLVIMAFDMSDLLNEFAYRKMAEFGDGGEPLKVSGVEQYEESRTSTQLKIRNWVYSHLFITTALTELVVNRLGDGNIDDMNLEEVVTRERRSMLEHTLDIPDYEDFDGSIGGVEDSVLRTRDLCERHGCKFILTAYPYGHQVNSTEWVPGRYTYLGKSEFEISDRTVLALEDFCARNGIPFINTFPDFRSYRGEELLYFKHDPHWTPTGHRLMAGSLAKFLVPYLETEFGVHAENCGISAERSQ